MRGFGFSCGVLAIFVLALAGCGGGDDEPSTAATTEATEAAALSKEELVAQGDAICAEVNAAVGTVGSTSSDAAGQAQQVAGLYGGMVERLKGLGAPSDESAGYAEFIAAAEALSQAEDNVKLAAERGEGEAEAAEEASSALGAFQSSASDFGLEACAEAPAAPTPGAGSGGESSGGETGGIEEGGEEVAPEEVTPAPEEAEPAPEAGGGVGGGGGTEGGGSGGGSSGGIGPG